jgi:ribosome biogenesis GTPase
MGGTLITPNKKSSLVVVGDEVYFIIDSHQNESTVFDETISESGYETGVIVAVEERKNSLARKVPGKSKREHIIAANADYLLLIMSAFQPQYNRRLIDRFLVAAELGGLNFAICINKIDLVHKDDLDILKEDFIPYMELGVETYFVSVDKDLHLDEVDEFLDGKRVILSGPSGVGKSSMVNYLLGDSIQTVNEISERTQKGQHTTSSVRMFDLDDDTQIIDTPGVREFGISGLDKEELSLYFHEFDSYFPNCKYPQCSHIHEPNCAVTEAVENGEIDYQRYESYVNLFSTLEDGF